MGWCEEDGKAVAKLVYAELLKKGELNLNEILNIFDSYEHPILRKTEGCISRALAEYKDVEKFRVGEYGLGYRLIKDTVHESEYKEVSYNHPNAVRAYELHDGDVFTADGLTLEFEKPFLYEVEKQIIGGYVVWLRTGRVFTSQQLHARRDNMKRLAEQEEKTEKGETTYENQ